MSSRDFDRDCGVDEDGDLRRRLVLEGCGCCESSCSMVRGSLRGVRRMVLITPVVLQAETSLSSVTLRLVPLSVRCSPGVVGSVSVLLSVRVLERSRGKRCAVGCWCTILCDIFG